MLRILLFSLLLASCGKKVEVQTPGKIGQHIQRLDGPGYLVIGGVTADEVNIHSALFCKLHVCVNDSVRVVEVKRKPE